MVNLTCNATLEDMRITAELPIAGDLTFHQLGLILSGGFSILAVAISFYSIWMHALHYTKPREQRHIIRILFMIPVYAAARFLSFWFYYHSVYYAVISDCYEAFAIASFFALLCHYTSPTLHEQKEYFRSMHPIQPWVWPLGWFAKCCGGDRGIWRTPQSGLTWFNIIWAGIYQYCFVRVAMTITAVVTQAFDVYCESSNMPWFAHVWVLVINAVAVTIAMYLVIQFYYQLRHDLAEHSPFLKVLAIKLVIFLSFWQTFIISILTSSTLQLLKANDHLAFPDLYVGIPSLLLCVEMAFFSILHIFAYPHAPYVAAGRLGTYPAPGAGPDAIGPNRGGPLGLLAFVDALNPWDMVKAFGRAIRWLAVGARRRKADPSYKYNPNLDSDAVGDDALPLAERDSAYRPRNSPTLPIAAQFAGRDGRGGGRYDAAEENAGLISHAQSNPEETMGGGGRDARDEDGAPLPPGSTGGSSPYRPARERYDAHTGREISAGGRVYAAVPEPGPGMVPARAGSQAHIHPALRQPLPQGFGIVGMGEEEEVGRGRRE